MRPRATAHIRALLRGETISFRVLRDELPLLEGRMVTFAPVKVPDLIPGDLVLCVVDGAQCIRRVTAWTPHIVRLAGTPNASSTFVRHDYVYGRSV